MTGDIPALLENILTGGPIDGPIPRPPIGALGKLVGGGGGGLL